MRMRGGTRLRDHAVHDELHTAVQTLREAELHRHRADRLRESSESGVFGEETRARRVLGDREEE